MVSIGGPIIIVEHNETDQSIIERLFRELNHKNELIFFRDGKNAFEYLKTDSVVPFLILSDIANPVEENYALRTMIQSEEEVRAKGLPYLFYLDRDTSKIYI